MEFDPSPKSRAAFDRLMAWPAPTVEYCIYFTPRSGSSWLTDLTKRSGYLGGAREYFNAGNGSKIAQAFGARNMDEYVAAIRRHSGAQGVFGVEITFFQLKRTFGEPDEFMKYFGDVRPFWLIREDIVAQAVSLWKKQQTGMAHSVSSTAEARAAVEGGLAYGDAGIAHWIRHVRRLEVVTERHFVRYGLDPVRMSYERMMAAGPEATRDALAVALGLEPRAPVHGGSKHEKIGTQQNQDFAARYRRRHPIACFKLARARRAMLAGLAED